MQEDDRVNSQVIDASILAGSIGGVDDFQYPCSAIRFDRERNQSHQTGRDEGAPSKEVPTNI